MVASARASAHFFFVSWVWLQFVRGKDNAAVVALAGQAPVQPHAAGGWRGVQRAAEPDDDSDPAGVGAYCGQVPHAHPITDLELRHGRTPSWWFGSLKSRPHRTAAPSPRCPGGKRGRRGL